MPWALVGNHPECSSEKPWAVVNRDTGEREGCHATREDAVQQQRALYASESRGVTDMAVEFKTLAIDVKEAAGGEFEAVLSTPIVDRDVEVVEPHAFDPLPERLKIHVDHNMTTRALVGSGTPFYEGDVLKVKGRFASTPLGQEVRQLILDGHLDGMSVGFIKPQREQKNGVTHLTRAELIEASFVTVPANVQALVTAAKSADGEKHLDLNSLSGRQAMVHVAYRRQNPRGYVLDVYDGFVIVSPDYDETGSYLRIPYTVDGDDVTFGEPTEVALDVQIREKGVKGTALKVSGTDRVAAYVGAMTSTPMLTANEARMVLAGEPTVSAETADPELAAAASVKDAAAAPPADVDEALALSRQRALALRARLLATEK